MSDEHFVLHVMNNLTKQYATEVRLLEDALDRGEEVSIDRLKEKFALEYERGTRRDEDDLNDEENEVNEESAFYASGFKGRCKNCGKYGHKAAVCKEKEKTQVGSSEKRFSGKCFHCGNVGHRAVDCRKKKREEQETYANEDDDY